MTQTTSSYVPFPSSRVFSPTRAEPVDPDSLPPELKVSHVNLNDGTVEGLRHTSLPVMSIQYHSEASPVPRDHAYIFDAFLAMVGEGARQVQI